MDPLVSTDWLAAHLGERDPRVADATLLDAATGRDARAEFEAGHVPGAVFLDLAELRDTNSPWPNMMPSPAKVASRLGALGLGDGLRIVLYDDSPWHTAARAWFVLRQFGIEASILDGGLAKWREEGRAVQAGPAVPRSRHLTLRERPRDVRTLDEVALALRTGDARVVDARSAARFSGAEADPRPGVAPGHMPGALNVPYGQLFAADGTWKRGDALRAAFTVAGVDPDARTIATCGSGVTAAVLLFGLHLLGRDGALYDGSWSEWGAESATAKVTSSPRP